MMSPSTLSPLPTESTVRRAETREATAIAELVNRAYRVESFFVGGERTSASAVRELMTRGEFFVLRRTEGGPAAAVHVETETQRGFLGLLAVDPEAQGSGLGRRLVGVAEAYCRAHGCEIMELKVVNLRRELPPWYQRLGYRPVGTEPFPPHPELLQPCHFIRMAKPLD